MVRKLTLWENKRKKERKKNKENKFSKQLFHQINSHNIKMLVCVFHAKFVLLRHIINNYYSALNKGVFRGK